MQAATMRPALQRPLLQSAAAPTAARAALTPRRRHTQPVAAANKPQRRGFFSEADTTAKVLPVKSGLSGDITKRGGRWESDFIWNKDWVKQLDYEESLRKQMAEGKEGKDAQGGGDGKGFLSLTGKVDLNSMDVDLSAQLRARKKSGGEASPSQQQAQGKQAPRRRVAPKYDSVPPTRLEQRIWERSGKFSRRVVPVAPTNEVELDALAAKVEAEQRRYDELKKELQAWAAGLTLVCFAATLAFYGRDVAASYGMGALGGLVYLRLLNKSVDAVGGGGGEPRLLIPVVLALAYSRYNALLSDQTGLTLQFLPILLGFFTYKVAVLAKQSLELFGELSGSQQQQAGEQEGVAGEDGSTAVDVASVDRAFRKSMLEKM